MKRANVSGALLLSSLLPLLFSPSLDPCTGEMPSSHFSIPFTQTYTHVPCPVGEDASHKLQRKRESSCFTFLLQQQQQPDVHLTHKIHTLTSMQSLSRERGVASTG